MAHINCTNYQKKIVFFHHQKFFNNKPIKPYLYSRFSMLNTQNNRDRRTRNTSQFSYDSCNKIAWRHVISQVKKRKLG
jgi:hypothetical protein